MSTYDLIYELVERIPEGKVASYGQIAALVACNPRQVGYAMAALPINSPIPWQRVINSKGAISMRSRGDGRISQRMLLEEEGVEFRANGTVDLSVYQWEP
jgi:methylated-DNA-protein-cysteine methyltransferase related protein